MSGLQPDTGYPYHIFVDDEPWAEGPRRDWVTDRLDSRGRDLEASGLTYDTRFRTFPDPDTPTPLRFAVLGDYGVGILAGGGRGERQSRLAAALERAVDHAGVRLIITTGDNIYLGEEDTVAGTGNHDDDWYYSFYEPYRYAISRVPVYPRGGQPRHRRHRGRSRRRSWRRPSMADQQRGGPSRPDLRASDPQARPDFAVCAAVGAPVLVVA